MSDKLSIGNKLIKINGMMMSIISKILSFKNGFDNSSFSSIIDGDNYIIGGGFTTYNNISYKSLVKLDKYGDIDTSFNITDKFNSAIRIIKKDINDKIIAGGNFTSYNNEGNSRIIRLNSDGTKDTSFQTGTGFTNDVFSIDIQNDNKIVVGGSFTAYSGTTQNRLIRLNTNGTKDTTFNVGNGPSSTLNIVKVLNDNRIMIGGSFGMYNSNSNYKSICIVTTGGTIDPSFNAGVGLSAPPNIINQQTDNKILVGGGFTYYSAVTNVTNRLMRLNLNASKDVDFNIGDGFNASVFAIEIQNDNKILVGGAFTTFSGSTQNRLIRLNIDGSKDTSFDIGTGFNNSIYDIKIKNNGYILVIGDFDNTPSPRIALLNSSGTIIA